MKPVIKPLDTRTEMRKALDQLIFEMPTQIEWMTVQAKLAKEQFDALKKQGFTDEQALHITTHQPSWK